MLQVLNKVQIDRSTTSSSTKDQHSDTHTHLLVLPHKNIQGELKHIKHEINKVLPEDKNMRLVDTGTKL